MSENWPKVAVVGAGAMGCLFGGLLAEGGLDVTLVDIWQAHVDTINQKGLQMLGHGGDRFIPVKATTHPSEVGTVDVVSVQCKAAFTTEAVRNAQSLFAPQTVAISFQNGLGNEEAIGEVIGMANVIGGLTAQGASMAGPGVVQNYSNLPSYIGEIDGRVTSRVERIARAFTEAGLQTSVSQNVKQDIWKKLMANIAVSPSCALADQKIKEVIAVPEMREIMFDALDEAALVAQAEGIALNVEESRAMLSQIVGSGGTGDNKSSLCVDVLNQRKTEIDFINGMIVKLGKQHGIPTPVNKTLVAAVKALESKYI